MPKKVKNLNNKERRIRKERLVKMLGGCCKGCGYDKCLSALSFHHRDPATKDFDISHNGNLLHDWDLVIKEALKCDLLCLNCHALLNEEEMKSKKNK